MARELNLEKIGDVVDPRAAAVACVLLHFRAGVVDGDAQRLHVAVARVGHAVHFGIGRAQQRFGIGNQLLTGGNQ